MFTARNSRTLKRRLLRVACLLLACPALLVACSTFSPAPYYDPPYYIDDFGRVFYSEGKEPWRNKGLAHGFGPIPPEAHAWNAYHAGFPALIDRPLFSAYPGGGYWFPIYRPPAAGGSSPQPGTGDLPTAPVVPLDPAMSTVPVSLPVRIIRYQPEPGDGPRSFGSRRSIDQGQLVRTKPGSARGHRPAAPRPAPRSSTPRARPRPVPGRPREIDPH